MAMEMYTMQFRYEVSEEEFNEVNGPDMAKKVTEIPGLIWKYWLHNPETKECLGVYHFKDRASVEAYMKSDWVKGFSSIPGYTLEAQRRYTLIEENSVITNAPGVKKSS